MPTKTPDETVVRKRKMGPKDKFQGMEESIEQSDNRPLLDSSEGEEEIDEGIVTAKRQEEDPQEAAWQIAVQVFIPYLVAGMGMVAAGMVLDYVQVCWAFRSCILYEEFAVIGLNKLFIKRWCISHRLHVFEKLLHVQRGNGCFRNFKFVKHAAGLLSFTFLWRPRKSSKDLQIWRKVQ